jgi:hypothetical protein
MRARTRCVLALLLWCTATALGQEGHPMVGSWSGDWAPTPQDQISILFVLEWKAKTLTGVMNPGFPDETQVRGALDSSKWTVHLEGAFTDERATPVTVVFDGTLQDIGSHNRTMTGTLSRGPLRGRLTLTRQ